MVHGTISGSARPALWPAPLDGTLLRVYVCVRVFLLEKSGTLGAADKVFSSMAPFVSTSRGHNYISCANTQAKGHWAVSFLALVWPLPRRPSEALPGEQMGPVQGPYPRMPPASQLAWKCLVYLHLISAQEQPQSWSAHGPMA